MYNVSESYKEQIRKTIRNPSYIKIEFSIVDPDAVGDATVSANDIMPWADMPELEDLHEVKRRYATCERGIWILDGSCAVPSGSSDKTYYQGYESSILSSNTNDYEFPIQITLTFQTGSYSFRGISFVFDSIQKIYPKSVTVEGYSSGTKVYEDTANITGYEFAYEEAIPGSNGTVDKIVFKFTKSRLPGQRLKIEEIILGVRKLFDESTVNSLKWTRKNDLMNTVIPTNEMSYTFYDLGKEYNPDNPDGVWEYLESGQAVKFKYGYELDDGSVEWTAGSILYTDGEPSITKGDTIAEVTFKAISKLQSLNDTYPWGKYNAAGTTLYDLAATLLRYAGVVDTEGNDDFILADKLKQYRTVSPLPVLDIKSLLQLIANAGMCVLTVDRYGKIEFKERKTTKEDFRIGFSDILSEAPKVSKYPYLKNVEAGIVTYTLGNEEELVSLEVDTSTGGSMYSLDYDAATNVTVQVSTGLTLVNTVAIGSYKATVELSGSGTLTIKGQKLTENKRTRSKTFNDTGEDCSLENPLINTQAHAISYIDWCADILSKRANYTFEDRGFPELDEGDLIGVDTVFTENKNAYVTALNISYNGALRGNMEVLS